MTYICHPLTRAILDGNVGEIKSIIYKVKDDAKNLSMHRSKVKSVKKVSSESQYVYDIGMKNTNNPWFFGNNLLVHNSAYFSAYPVLKEEIKKGEIKWTKENVTKLYDTAASEMNDSFPEFMHDKFNVPVDHSTGVIAAGREIIGETGIFVKKKRYAILVYDDEGIRKDVNGNPGKVKAMGLDLRRADTPKFVQEFLSEILIDTLTDKGEEYVVNKVTDFKDNFRKLPPWKKGTPKAVNGLTRYRDKLDAQLEAKLNNKQFPKFTTPGHVKASMNWNQTRAVLNDMHVSPILDGHKVIVCDLKITSENVYKSIAYPVDEKRLPTWFTELPFDEEMMMEKIVDKKVDNLLGILKWDFSSTSFEATHFATLFDV